MQRIVSSFINTTGHLVVITHNGTKYFVFPGVSCARFPMPNEYLHEYMAEIMGMGLRMNFSQQSPSNKKAKSPTKAQKAKPHL